MNIGEKNLDKKGRLLIYKHFIGEAALIVMMIFASIIIPAFKAELFPYSSFALFTDSPQQYVEYKIFDGNGKKLNLKQFFLQRNYCGISPRAPYARLKPLSFDQFGTILNESEVKKAIMMGFKINPEVILPLNIFQTVFRPTKDGMKKRKSFHYKLSLENKWESIEND